MKKLENWTLWIIADIITVPLYASRGWGMLSLQYLIFTVLAIQGYRHGKKYRQQASDLFRVVLFGPESTGKTTLSALLASHYGTEWVPEYAREYLQDKWDREGKICEPHDLLPIAKGQMRLENQMAQKANGILICDTDLLETKVYAEAYYGGECDPALERHALGNQYDLYLLTYIDTPWVADDLRDRPDSREEMFQYFETALIKNKRNFVTLKGDLETRLQTAIACIDKLRNNRMDFTKDDLRQLAEKGIPKSKVEDQIKTFRAGIPFVTLVQAATPSDGIEQYTEAERNALRAFFDDRAPDLDLLKFVPASGAASRMFKALFKFLATYDPTSETFESYVERTGDTALARFLEGLEDLPFYETVMARLADNGLSQGQLAHAFIGEMLSEEGLDYGFYPKGLLPFHRGPKVRQLLLRNT